MVYNRLEQTVELSSKYIIKIICKADDFNKTSVQLLDIFTKIFFQTMNKAALRGKEVDELSIQFPNLSAYLPLLPLLLPLETRFIRSQITSHISVN